ncbi:photosystem I reaction center subunit VI, chloroplastic-like [Ananas comosus]|uniref:Photosystem I reaction center subunit VI n=1 Tax=Ananas comosus TaxID=4615 RepID=A0A6P5GKU9_ANACO|nr:photosystem I reaction center subunit VI, chloroplastic-like [Ananas comosus]
MASLAAVAAVQPVAVNGLAGSSLGGARLAVRPSLCRAPRRSGLRSRSGAVVAKYGEKSVYFDLEDLGNTTGQWDLYGSDAPSPYNPLQSKFFETFVAPFTKRGLLLKFLILGGGSLLAYVSSTASGDVLPIKKGPQLPPQKGPRDKI